MGKLITGSALDVSDVISAANTGVLQGPSFSRVSDIHLLHGLSDLHDFYQQDSYVVQSVNKYSDLVLKGGITLESNDPRAARWLYDRLWLMAWLNGQNLEEWYRSIAQSIVLYANAFLLRYRTRKADTQLDSPTTLPIAGYYILPAEKIRFVLDSMNRIKGVYLADNVGPSYGLSTNKAWPANRVLHLYYNRPPGGILGFSPIFAALEDIRMLRMLEDISVEMIYKNINPIVHAQVGNGVNVPGGSAAIDNVTKKLKEMTPHNAFLVTNQFTALTMHGAESKSLRPEGLLRFYRERVMAGLGMSELSLGNVSVANRSGSDVVTNEMHDRVDTYREHMRQLENNIFIELLVEGGYNPIFNPDHRVRMVFKDVDPSAEIKTRTHWNQMYVQGTHGLNEARVKMGELPVDEKTGWEDFMFARVGSQGSSGISNTATPVEDPKNKK